MHLSFWRAISSIPPVLVGLLVYLLLSHQGPLGFLHWLFTPKALVTAQFLLALPMAISLCLQHRINLPRDMEEFIDVNLPAKRMNAMLLHLRGGLVNIAFLTWGRILGEVGAATLSGGAIVGYTSTLATEIMYRTNLGQFGNAIAMGIILLLMSLIPSLILEVSTRGQR
jgi:tungstate transport system permease protein